MAKLQIDKTENSSASRRNNPWGEKKSWNRLGHRLGLGHEQHEMSGTIAILILMAGALVIWATITRPELQNWLELLTVSMVLMAGVVLFNWALRKNEQRARQELKIAEWYAQHERELELERFRETAFQTYLDRMTDLLLEKGLRQSKPSAEVRDIARARTLTVLRGLDGPHKGILVRFLYEADLIKSRAIIDLSGADLSGAHLKKANLNDACLGQADLSGADLGAATLNKANLHRAILIVADLSGADLYRANLSQANLTEALLVVAKLNETDLSYADLHGANLEGADLIRTNLRDVDLHEAILIAASLTGANLTGANLHGANLEAADLIEATLHGADLSRANLKGATLRGVKYNRQTQWPQGFIPADAGAILVD